MRLVIAALAFCSLAGSAAAQSAPPSARATQLSHEIYESLGGPTQISALINRTMTSAMASMPATTVNGKDMRADMAAFMQAEMTKIIPETIAASERVYAETFTEAQLQDVLAFYRSPTGRVFVAKLPEVTTRTVTLMTPAIRRMQADMLNHICDLKPCTPPERAQVAKLTGG